MNRSNLYIERNRWAYPEELMDEIISEIDKFYTEFNLTKKGYDRITRFNNEPAFFPLREYIANKSKFDDKEIPDLSWIQDFYNKEKHGKQLTKAFFESLLSAFNYHYDAETNQFKKRKPKEYIENEDLNERHKILKYIISKSKTDNSFLKEFFGTYKYFVGGRKNYTRYDYIYENEIFIFNNSEIEVRNPFNGHTYIGYATIKTNSCLQLISFDFDNQFLDGIGNLLTFKINKYAKQVKLIPGTSTSFDADGKIIFAQALLCSDTSLNKKSPIIREYFDKVISGLRLYSPEIKDVEKLVNKYYKE